MFRRRNGRPAKGLGAEREALQRELDTVPWSDLSHAYGPALDVPALLLAVTFGDDAERGPAWWELWGNVHHQGTVYPATVPVVSFIERLAADPNHRDRVQAISFLQALATGGGSAAKEVRARVEASAIRLMAESGRRSELDQRALLWLASAFSDPAWNDLAVERLPAEHLEAWREAQDEVRLRDDGADDELEAFINDDGWQDRRSALEAWLLEGWVELPTK